MNKDQVKGLEVPDGLIAFLKAILSFHPTEVTS